MLRGGRQGRRGHILVEIYNLDDYLIIATTKSRIEQNKNLKIKEL